MAKDRGQKIHDKAMKDSAKNDYDPPHDRGILGEYLWPYSDKEISERKSYTEQWRSNRDNIKHSK